MTLLIILLVMGGQILFFENTDCYVVPSSEKPVENPLKGWAPWISTGEYDYPVNMAFVLWKWSEIEPEEGRYEFDVLEEKYHMNELKENGTRFIIRIVSDYPSGEQHMDIPQWLYDKTGGDGTWYDISYGKGYSPNYYNSVFINEHKKLIEAFGEYYSDNPYIAFVELGSLGHWGEWHVKSSSGITPFPDSVVSDEYIRHYLDNFPSSKLLLRRPFGIGASERLGLYNDSFGQSESHNMWLGWIQNGYVSEQTKESLSGMPDFWQYAPSGGEFASSFDTDYYFSDGFDETMELLYQSHTTFIGPHCAARVKNDGLTDNVLKMSSEMGYCFRITDTKLKRKIWGGAYKFIINISNIGIAPIYENWMLLVQVCDENGVCIYENFYDINIDKILPGTAEREILLEGFEPSGGKYFIQAGLVDPVTGKAGIKFANQGETENCMYKIMEFERSNIGSDWIKH